MTGDMRTFFDGGEEDDRVRISGRSEGVCVEWRRGRREKSLNDLVLASRVGVRVRPAERTQSIQYYEN